MNTYSYVENNPLRWKDPTGKLIITAGICTVAGGVNSILNHAELNDLLETLNSINDQIQMLENQCPMEKQPDWYSDYIRKLRKEALQATAAYAKANATGVLADEATALSCAAALSAPFLP